MRNRVIATAALMLAAATAAAADGVPPAGAEAAAGGTTVCPAPAAGSARVWTLDRARSRIAFRVRTNVQDRAGTIGLLRGRIAFDPERAPRAFMFEVDADTRSLRTDDRTAEELMHKYVLETKYHPTARFKSTAGGCGPAAFPPRAGETISIEGRLSIRHKSNVLTVPVRFRSDGSVLLAAAELDLDRGAFDLRVPELFIVMADPTVHLSIELAFVPADGAGRAEVSP